MRTTHTFCLLLLLACLLAGCGDPLGLGAVQGPSVPAPNALPTVSSPTVQPPTATTRPLPATATPTLATTPLAALLQATLPALPTPIPPTPTPTPLPMGSARVDLVNLRAAPSLAGELLGQVDQATRFTILQRSADGQWLNICCPLDNRDASQPLWIAAELVQIENNPVLTNALTTTITAQINADLVNLRAGPGVAYTIVGQANTGQQYAVLGKSTAEDWWKLGAPIGSDALWVSNQFIVIFYPPGQDATAVNIVPAPPLSTTAATTDAQVATAAANPAAGLPGAGGFGAAGGTNPLTGLPFGRGGQRPIIVCINNDYAARPQLGTSNADVVYEYLMEGYGITRFSAIFWGEDAAQIGPVRSARLINYYLGSLYDAGTTCSGASDAVRYALKHEAPFPYLDIDLDDPNNSRYSVSIGNDYRTRLRTNTPQLRQWLVNWGAEQPASVRGFHFGGLAGGGVTANAITIPYPSGAVAYQYDPASGRYLRFLGGAPHVDGNTGGQLAVENVIAQVVPHEATNIVEDSLGSTSIRLNLFGSGSALLFRDGQAFVTTWRSDSRGDTPHFFAADGSEIALKPGKTWISVVPVDYTVGYQ